jgi:hypothetical protein
MTSTSTARARVLVRGLLWFLPGLLVLVATLLVGWVPPELAAWVSWRRRV